MRIAAVCLFASGVAAAQRPPDIPLTPAINRDVVAGIVDAVTRYYVTPDAATRVAADLRARAARGEYDAVTSAFALIDALDAHLQAASGDAHLKVAYSSEATPLVPGSEHRRDTPEEIEEDRRVARSRNFGFEKTQRLTGNVGLLEMGSFERPEFAGPTLGAAMTFLATTDALIVDLRTSRGGSIDMVPYLASYFFQGDPVHLGDMYWRVEKRAQQLWTVPYVPGGAYVDRDVYILTSRSTFSAPEGLASFLQHHKRAIIVGEPTRGGTHPGAMIKVHTNFAVFVPLGKPVYPSGVPTLVFGRMLYPASTPDDEGTGIKPDLPVSSADALTVAHADALTRLIARHPERRAELQAAIDRLTRR